MSKELDEAWVTIYHYNEEIIHDMGSEYVENPLKEELDIVNNALLELKAIREANPSEALEDLEQLAEMADKCWVSCDVHKWKTTIKQVLLKAHEKEKENARNEEILQKYYQEGITLDSVRALKQERDNYKRVLETIKEKPQASLYLIQLGKIKTYEEYLEYTSTWDLDEWGDMVYTKEEFDLLKRWLG